MMKSRVSTPAAASACIAAKRRSGRGARGSSVRASAASRVTIEKLTESSPRRASSPSRCASRETSVDLVVIESRRPGTSRAASSRRRVTSNRPSTGW